MGRRSPWRAGIGAATRASEPQASAKPANAKSGQDNVIFRSSGRRRRCARPAGARPPLPRAAHRGSKVREPCLPRGDFARKASASLDTHVRGVRRVAQRIDDEVPHARESPPHAAGTSLQSLRYAASGSPSRRKQIAIHLRPPVLHAAAASAPSRRGETAPSIRRGQRAHIAGPAILAIEGENENALKVAHRLRRGIDRQFLPVRSKRAADRRSP